MKTVSVQYRTLLLLLALLLGGCAAARITRPEPLVSAPAAGIAEHLLLDISVNLFTPIAEPAPATDAEGLQSLRTAEGHYLSWQLAQTLQDSGYWGTVRLNPFMRDTADLTIAGTLLQSDGETLRIHVNAVDSTGRAWLDREYLQLVDDGAYTAAPGVTPPFPFQPLLNRISNDILAFRANTLKTPDVENIRKISALRFAADFAPGIYAPYLTDGGGQFFAARLPPLNDPVYAQIATIGARNSLFLDAIQAQYAVFVAQVDEPYRKFLARSSVITDILNGRFRAEESEAQYGASIDLGVGVTSRNKVASRFTNANKRSDALNSGGNARIYSAALTEAGATFEMVVQPQTLEFSEHTVQLSGSLDEQFAQWRDILGEIHELNAAP